ncbi:MAG: penicillin-binding transpeptidase domain-containing protein [Peptococcaceae bacterium]|nr:penicillin-binding transpeptidase domain-containing protein [Peptococcaceae bacterium]
MEPRKTRIPFIIVFAVAFLAIVISLKLFYVQVLASEKYSDDSLNNRLQNVEVTPNRGIIYDRNNEAMAISVEKMSVYITPSVIRESSSRDEIVDDIVECLHMTKSEVNKIIDDSSSDFAWLKRQCEKADAEKLQEKDYLGIGFTTEYAREYPNNEEACHVLGFCGLDNQGLAGIELQYDDTLAGTPGKLVVEFDKLGNAIPQSIQESIPASQGQNIHLTIDSTIQYYVESALAEAQKEQNAEAMTSIVMDVNTGEILAMANIPDFDPNNYGDYEPETWTNLAISKLYEPGSPFKSLSTSMYLEEDIVEPDTQLYCPGYVMIDGHRFQDWDYPEGDGLQTMKHAVEQSCNVAQAECVSKLGFERFYDYLDGFGMTKKTGVDLPSESSPLMIDEDDAVDLDLASSAIGQGNAYTALQMITAFSAVVNGGYLMKPQIVSEITDNDGDVVEKTEPEVVRQVISEETSEQMRDILEGVVEEGLGTPAAVEGYRVGGKTGTAEIASGGTYEDNNYILSFMGFAPADDPKYACLVVVDSPESGGNSGTLAGGIFAKIMNNVLNYYQIPQTEAPSEDNENITEAEAGETVTVPDLDLPMSTEEARAIMQKAGLQVSDVTTGDQLVCCLPASGTKVAAGSTVEFYSISSNSDSIILPSFEGKTIKDVDLILNGFGLQSNLSGSGLAYRQQPAAGTSVTAGSEVKVWFAGTSELASIQEATEQLQEKNNDDSASESNTGKSSDSSSSSTSDQSSAKKDDDG